MSQSSEVNGPDVTVVCLVRHGHATAAVVVESLYRNTRAPIRVIYVDIASPPKVNAYLAEQAATRDGFVHLRFDDLVSRQTARMRALETVETEWVALIDNNVICEPTWLESLLRARDETGASLVSPVIVTRGGDLHFSTGTVERRRTRRSLGQQQVVRIQDQPGAPRKSNLADVELRRMAIDFAESHGCFAEVAALRLPGVLEESMHNAHTLCYAAYSMKHDHGKRLVVEPSSVVSLVPISFGYDMPWILGGYMRADLIRGSYKGIEKLIGKGPGTRLGPGLRWHARHLKYLLMSMLEDDRLERDDLLSLDEIPDYIKGYDHPLPRDGHERIQQEIVPFVRDRYPDLLPVLEEWLSLGTVRRLLRVN